MITSPIVAVPTPFQADGSIDLPALGDCLQLLAAAGVHTLLMNGTTGEFASLTGTERRTIVEYCRAHWTGDLIAHIGTSAVGESIALARHAADHADHLAVIVPYLFAEAPELGLEHYLAQLLEATTHPVLLYNFPRHTQNPLSSTLVARLAARFPHLCGIKDSGKDLTVSREFKLRCPRLRVFIGDDCLGARVPELGHFDTVWPVGTTVEWPFSITDGIATGPGTFDMKAGAVFGS